jgi:hypothetical protein
LHAYWPLEQPLNAAKLERANRRLARALAACQSAVTNAAAILRLLSVAESARGGLCPLVLLRTRLQRKPVVAVEGRRG